jgi:hypothetical protein
LIKTKSQSDFLIFNFHWSDLKFTGLGLRTSGFSWRLLFPILCEAYLLYLIYVSNDVRWLNCAAGPCDPIQHRWKHNNLLRAFVMVTWPSQPIKISSFCSKHMWYKYQIKYKCKYQVKQVGIELWTLLHYTIASHGLNICSAPLSPLALGVSKFSHYPVSTIYLAY